MMYFTSDWHVGEQQLPDTHSYLRPRPTEIMVEEWLEHCHATLKPDDTLVFLGDAIITLDDLEKLQELPECEKVLIAGDKETDSKQFTSEELIIRNEDLDIFRNVMEGMHLTIAGHDFFLAHKPLHCINICNKNGNAALCGHVHGIWRTQRMPNGQPIINVGIDAWGGLVSEAFIAHQYACVMKGYYDEHCFPADWS